MDQVTFSENSLTDSGFNDVLVGASLFKTLNISPVEFNDPTQFSKIRDIAGYFNGSPDPQFELQSVMKRNRSQGMKPLDYLWSYVELRRQRGETEKKLQEYDKQLSYYK